MTPAEKIMQALASSGNTWCKVPDGIEESEEIVIKDGLCTTKEVDAAENMVARGVISFLKPPLFENKDVDPFISEFEEMTGAKLAPQQKDGVRMIAKYRMSVLTGGAGTGKTTTLRCVTYVLRKLMGDSTEVCFTAPTGKAARRITESTGEFACTLQKLLGMGYDGKCRNLISKDVIFCDESSMNDIFLMASLFKNVSRTTKLVFVGDSDQIPSVGIGAALRDLIECGKVPKTMLTQTFRQKDGCLLDNLIEIRKGKDDLKFGDEFNLALVDEKQKGSKLMEMLVEQYNHECKKFGRDNVTVLLPYRKSGFCSNLVNMRLQQEVNPKGAAWVHTDKEGTRWTFRVGDPVMQLKNRAECVNGEIGRIAKVSPEGILVAYEDGEVLYPEKDMDELALAYSISITKSQGSEYKSVICVVLNTHKHALNRNILYTGLSRAKQKCTLLCHSDALATSIANSANGRVTRLVEKINDEWLKNCV